MTNVEHKLAITDHADIYILCVIDWEGAKVVDRGTNRCATQAIWIKKTVLRIETKGATT